MFSFFSVSISWKLLFIQTLNSLHSYSAIQWERNSYCWELDVFIVSSPSGRLLKERVRKDGKGKASSSSAADGKAAN